MRAVIQRVKEARVKVDGATTGSIGQGLLVLLGIHKEDTQEQLKWAAEKVAHLRIFSDEKGKFQHDVQQVKGNVLVVSQFTLFGDCSRGRRPEFFEAAEPAKAEALYAYFVEALKNFQLLPQTGLFGAKMEVFSINDGPVTLILER